MSTAHLGKTILLVDDEPLLLRFVGIVLQQAGYEVVPIADAAEAILIAESSRHLDALVTDVDMGKGCIDGFRLARLVQATHPGIGVIVISGSLEAEDQALEQGFPFLAKPFTAATLTARLDELHMETVDTAGAHA